MRVLLPILGYRFFPSIPLNILWHSLLAWRVSVDKSADILMGVLLYVICHFSLFAFTILSLPLTLVSLITICLSVLFFLEFILPGTVCLLYLVDYFLLGMFSAIISPNIFSGPLSSSYPSGASIMRMLLHLMLSPRSLRLSSFHSFFFILFHGSDFHHPILQLTYLFFSLSYSAIDSF